MTVLKKRPCGRADLQQSCAQEHRDVRRVRGGGAADGEEHDRGLRQHGHRAPRGRHAAGVHPLRELGEDDSLRRDALALFRSGALVVGVVVAAAVGCCC